VDQANGEPPVLVDRRTAATYVLLRSETYAELTKKDDGGESIREVPEGIRLARAAFRRDLLALLQDRKMRGKYVCYHKDGCAAVARTYGEIVREFARHDFPEDQFLVEKVMPGDRPDEEDFDSTRVGRFAQNCS